MTINEKQDEIIDETDIRHGGGKVLEDGAAEGCGYYLHATADAEERQVAVVCHLCEEQFAGVAAGVDAA
ncbi:hypothetical protein IMSAGC014_02327 [Bacteroidaceae bacterium]|nr:hypothetical protein IMSAGC014_02327 [Bacteroidaceae bacterium]